MDDTDGQEEGVSNTLVRAFDIIRKVSWASGSRRPKLYLVDSIPGCLRRGTMQVFRPS